MSVLDLISGGANRWRPGQALTPGSARNTGSGGSIWYNPRPVGGGGMTPPTIGGGSTSPNAPVSGSYPEAPLPPLSPPTHPAVTSPSYLPGAAPPTSAPPTVDYGDLLDRIRGLQAPTMGAAGGPTLDDIYANRPEYEDEARRRLAAWLDSGGYNVSGADASHDPETMARMQQARGRSAATAAREAANYARQTGRGSGSAAYATRQGILSLLGDVEGNRAASDILDQREQYLTAIAEANANRGLSGMTSAGSMENAANALLNDRYRADMGLYEAGTGRYNAETGRYNELLNSLKLQGDLAHQPYEDWLASQSNARGNQGAFDSHTAADDARYNTAYQQWRDRMELELKRQQLADDRARLAAQGPLGAGEMVIGPDGRVTTRLPVPTTGGVGGGATGGVPGGVVTSVIPPTLGNVAGAGGNGASGNAPRTATSARAQMVATLKDQLASAIAEYEAIGSSNSLLSNRPGAFGSASSKINALIERLRNLGVVASLGRHNASEFSPRVGASGLPIYTDPLTYNF